MHRREFISMLGAASAAGLLGGCAASTSRLYDAPLSGNARILHITDCHAQLQPIYFREPSVNLGYADAYGRPPHLVGRALLDYYGDSLSGWERHALTCLDFEQAAREYGKVGGFAHLKTLVDQQRAAAGEGNSLLLDGGDTWQGSATSSNRLLPSPAAARCWSTSVFRCAKPPTLPYSRAACSKSRQVSACRSQPLRLSP